MVEVKKVSEGDIKDLYRVCIAPTDEYAAAVQESGNFFLGKLERGWQGLVVYEDGNPVGRAEFSPLEESFAAISGESLYFMPCLYIPEKHRGKGYGKALMNKVLRETSNSKGLVTVTCEGWMPKEFFEKLGFVLTERIGTCYLMLRKHEEDAAAEFLASSFTPRNEEGRVSIDVVMNCQCPFMTVNYEKLMNKAKDVSDRVEVTQYLLRDREDLRKYGEMNFYIDGEAPFIGPGSEEEIEKLVNDHLSRKHL